MCIRDRRRYSTNFDAHQYILEPLHTGSKGLLCGHWGALVSVSYTHLRAHETVLDIVCRLLLEKKKSQNSTTSEHENKRHTDTTRQLYIHVQYRSVIKKILTIK